MRVVLTGATGNLGIAVLSRLEGAGHDVVAVAREVPPDVVEGSRSGDSAPRRAASNRTTWVPLDLSDPHGAIQIRKVLTGSDACVHLAWALQPMHNRGHQRRTNLGGSAVCLGSALEVGVRQMVVASSIAAYSPRRGPELVDESYPTGGIPRCAYSRDKAVLEGLVRDVTKRAQGRMRVAAIRPSLVGQRAAGSQMLRMGLPVLTPARLLRHLPVLGVDRSLGLQAVHADDVADAVVRILEQEREGPFNVVADGVLDAQELADIFGARHVHVPWRVTRAVAAAAWHARLQPLDPGWIEMAHRVPWVSAARARDELGWEPAHTARDVLAELVRGMSDRASAPTRPLRERDLGEELMKTVKEGPASHRSHT